MTRDLPTALGRAARGCWLGLCAGGRRRPGRVRRLTWLAGAAASALTIGAAGASGSGREDPFAFFRPWVRVTDDDREKLDRDEVIVRTLPADDGHLAVFAAAKLETSPEALVGWTRVIDDFKRGPFVLAAGRFSESPVERDLERLTFDPGDVDALQRCRPGDCAVKLATAEIEVVRAALQAAGPDWKAAAQRALKRVVLERVRGHQAGGFPVLPAYADRSRPASLYEAFAAIVTRSPYLVERLPGLVAALETPAHAAMPGSEALYYWSKERYGTGKPVVTVTHVRFWRSEAAPFALAAVSASAQIFATHYTNAALGLTTVVCESPGAPCYLVYVNRTQVDFFGGILGGVKRAVAGQRVESQTPDIVRGLRDRLQTQPPPR